jgi:general L-amino acid transport system permease protein
MTLRSRLTGAPRRWWRRAVSWRGAGSQSVRPWRDIRVLRALAQVAIIVVVLALALWLWNNLTGNMQAARMSFGLGFLDSRAGFPIAESPLRYSPSDTYGHAYLVGLANTVVISISGIVLATILGIIVGVARLSTNWLVNKITSGYIELMRNTPLLVQLVFLYAIFLQLPSIANAISLPGPTYLSQRGLFMPRPMTEPGFGVWLALVVGAVVLAFLASRWSTQRLLAARPTYGAGRLGLLSLLAIPVIGWLVLQPVSFDAPVQERFNFVGGVVLSPEFTALLLGLVIYTAAFIGEVVRGGIQAVRRGQIEAAHSIGLSNMQTLRLIVFPQALRIIVPPTTSQYLNLAKNSSLAIAIGFPDLFSVSRTMANQTAQPVPVIILVMATYLAFSLITSLLMNLYNRRVQVLER